MQAAPTAPTAPAAPAAAAAAAAPAAGGGVAPGGAVKSEPGAVPPTPAHRQASTEHGPEQWLLSLVPLVRSRVRVRVRVRVSPNSTEHGPEQWLLSLVPP